LQKESIWLSAEAGNPWPHSLKGRKMTLLLGCSQCSYTDPHRITSLEYFSDRGNFMKEFN
jgi:hypothetical protein